MFCERALAFEYWDAGGHTGSLWLNRWSPWLETKSPDPRIGAVRAILEAFQSSLLDRKAANDLLITYLRAEAVVLTAWEKILDCVLTRGIALSSEGRLGDIVDRES